MTSDTLSDCPKDPDAVLIAIQDETDSRQLTGSVMCYYEPKGGGGRWRTASSLSKRIIPNPYLP